MTRTARPAIRKLNRAECISILARNHVGRVGYARESRIDVEPVHYVYWDGWIFGRTSPGAKTEMTGPGWWPVAFEVDESEHLFRWRSVLVHGGFYTLSVESAADAAQWRLAVEHLRTLIPESLTEDDPVAFRTIVFGISVQEISGREANPELSPASAPEKAGGRAPQQEAYPGESEGLSKAVLLLGPASRGQDRILAALRAAGYRVLSGTCAEDLAVIASATAPRVIVARAEAPEEWRRLLSLLRQGAHAVAPVVLVGSASLPIEGVSGVVPDEESCYEPTFTQRILEEVQYADQLSSWIQQPPAAMTR